MAKQDKENQDELSMVTYGRVIEFRAAAEKYLAYHPNGVNMVAYALSKLSTKLRFRQTEYMSKMEQIRLTLASKDDKNNVIMDAAGHYSFTAEAKLKLETKSQDLYDKEIEIKPMYVAPELWPTEFNVTWIDVFQDFIVRELSPEEFLTLKIGPQKKADPQLES